MKVKIEFDLPEESQDLQQALDGFKWELVVWQIDQWLRKKHKYDIENQENISIEEVCEFILDTMNEHQLYFSD